MSIPGTSSILHFFPLHDPSSRDDLARVWFGWRVNPWQQPLDDIKEYLGEKIALYFAFTGHYTTWLVPLSIASVIIIIYYFVLYCESGTLMEVMNNGFLVPFFCIFVAVWAQLMLEYWKREVCSCRVCRGNVIFLFESVCWSVSILLLMHI